MRQSLTRSSAASASGNSTARYSNRSARYPGAPRGRRRAAARLLGFCGNRRPATLESARPASLDGGLVRHARVRGLVVVRRRGTLASSHDARHPLLADRAAGPTVVAVVHRVNAGATAEPLSQRANVLACAAIGVVLLTSWAID